MRIGELALRTGVSARSLRYYESNGLLEADRGVGGQREYDESAVDRVALIQHLLAAGLVMVGIRPIVAAVERGRSDPALVVDLEARRAELALRVDALTIALGRLDAVIEVARVPEAHCEPEALT